MKCTPMKLYSRRDNSRLKLEKYFQKSYEETESFAEKNYGYSLSFVRKLHEDPREYPKISVKTIKLPENINSYNAGSSVDKWSQKKPRLKSANKKISQNNIEVLDENAYDITEILNTLGNLDPTKEDCNILEVHSDIEELWRKSQGGGESCREVKQKSGDKKHDNFCKKKIKHKLKKCIKFSISKPPSPQTEQVIRVDISSTISLNELRQIEQTRGNINKSPSKLDRVNQRMDFQNENEDFIVYCSQLAIEPKKN